MANFIPSTQEERLEMLRCVGVSDYRELYRDVPSEMYLDGGLNIPEGMSELEVGRAVSAMAAKNHVFPPFCGVPALMTTTSPASSNTSPPRKNSSPPTPPIRRK